MSYLKSSGSELMRISTMAIHIDDGGDDSHTLDNGNNSHVDEVIVGSHS